VVTWLLYGANGYTGTLVARLAVARGERPVLAGRSGPSVAGLAAELGLEHRVFGLGDPAALRRGLAGVDAVAHCAGPFSATAGPMARACIDAGLEAVAPARPEIQRQVEDLRLIAETLDPQTGRVAERRKCFTALQERLESDASPFHQHLSKLMGRWAPGLFGGGNAADVPWDNLDLERWFRLPKGHERRIHGHRHAGIRLVLEGPTLMPALDAHRDHDGTSLGCGLRRRQAGQGSTGQGSAERQSVHAVRDAAGAAARRLARRAPALRGEHARQPARDLSGRRRAPLAGRLRRGRARARRRGRARTGRGLGRQSSLGFGEHRRRRPARRER